MMMKFYLCFVNLLNKPVEAPAPPSSPPPSKILFVSVSQTITGRSENLARYYLCLIQRDRPSPLAAEQKKSWSSPNTVGGGGGGRDGREDAVQAGG